MNRNRSVAALTTCLLTPGMAVALAPAGLNAQSSDQTTVDRWQGNRSNPYSRLFESRGAGPADDPIAPPASVAPESVDGRRIMCGMTMVPANPSVDPGMAIDRQDQSTRFTIRAVEPVECWLSTRR